VSLYSHRYQKRHYGLPGGEARNTPIDIAVIESGFITWLMQTTHAGDRILTRMPHADWGKDIDGKFVVSRVLRMENFKEEWECLCLDWDLPKVATGKQNIGTGASLRYKSFYDDESREFVAEHFAEDIQRWGYAF